MTVKLVRGTRWATLINHLAEELAAAATNPFQTLRVVVSSRATGRIVGQQVAARLGISAGIDYLSLTDLQRQLAEQAGVGPQRSRWQGTPLDLAVAEALTQVSHPLIQRALSADGTRPGRRRATATRIARVLRSYADHAPALLAGWLAGSEQALDGTPMPARLAWQPHLFRTVTAILEADPLSIADGICAAARQDGTPTFVLAVDHLTNAQHQSIQALAEGPGINVLQPTGSPGDEWATRVATEILDLPGDAAPAPVVEVHNSHCEARQVAVLRDELTRAFAEDPTLEPRDVAIICPRPERYAALLTAAFAPADEPAHPGRTLRLQPPGSFATDNTVLHLLVQIIRLGTSRATAKGIVDLLLSPPLAHRWRLQERRTVTELVSGAGIRWGLDEAHRASFDLADVPQNTWARGIDRLLIGLAVAPHQDSGLGLSGTDAVTASDLTVVGSLAEVLTRLRRSVSATAQPATMQEWVDRCRAAITDLVDLPFAEQWQRLHALKVLARFERNHRGSGTLLTPHEFAHLLDDAAAPPRARAASGNGSMQVVALGELQHVEFRLVAMLGITDDVVPGRGAHLPDSVDLAELAPDAPGRRLHQLLTHAGCAERVLIVRQARSQRTNDPVASPVAVNWLLEQLGATDPPGTDHPPIATSTTAFGTLPSFDAAAHDGARARASLTTIGTMSRTARRRADARTRPLGPAPTEVSLTDLATFLKDPARTFLRAAGNIALYDEAELIDEMPLEVHGLEHWRIVDALVDSWKEGTSPGAVADHFRQREDLPPQAIGEVAFETAKQEAILLHGSAGHDWNGALTTHPIDVTVTLADGSRVQILDEVRTRDGMALAVTPSQQVTGIFQPWLESLALTAQGAPTPAKLHHFVKSYGVTSAVPWLVAPPTPEQALGHLTTLVDAFTQAQHRLLPVPSAPALTYAREHATNRFNRAEWSGPIGHFRSKWNRSERSWRVFFAADVRELFEDQPLPADPANGQETAFQAWAWALYAPLTGGAQ